MRHQHANRQLSGVGVYGHGPGWSATSGQAIEGQRGEVACFGRGIVSENMDSKPSNDGVRTCAFWSPCHRYLFTVFVTDTDITVTDDNGVLYEPAGDEQVFSDAPPASEMSELPTPTDDGAKRLQAAIDEDFRLQGLTNEQLVAECAQSTIGSDATVREWSLISAMMDRLDPNWANLTPAEEAEKDERIAGLAPDIQPGDEKAAVIK
jgi:hypothetical protein